MKNKLYILILILILSSCLNMTEPEMQAVYIESYKSFDKEMVEHFPKKIPNNYIQINFSKPEYISEWNNHANFSIKVQIASKEKFEREKTQLEKEAMVIKNSADSCLLIVDSYETQNLINCDNCYPIPQETIYDYKKNEWIRIDNCEIAFLDYKPGIFIEDKGLTVKESLPGRWSNGFSKGYAFNNKEQTIMYWLIIW